MRPNPSLTVVLTTLCALCTAPHAGAQGQPLYRITQTVQLGAPERWDYVVVDPRSHRVYVAHGGQLTVVDGTRGTVVGEVTGFPGGTHGTAIAGDLGKGYTDDGNAGEAGGFDLATLKASRHLKVEEDADAMVYDPASHHVFVMSGAGGVSVIDPRRDAVVATIAVGGSLEYAAVDGAGRLYVNGASTGEIDRINTATNAVEARWPLPGCQRPHGLAIDTAHHRLFSSCVNAVMAVVDTDSGRLVTTVPIGHGSDAAAFDPVRGRILSANGRDGTVSVIQEKDPDTYVPLGEVATAVSARTLGVDTSSGRLYLVAADSAKAPDTAALPAGAPPARPVFLPGSTRLLILDPLP